jgi:hypothetical protein
MVKYTVLYLPKFLLENLMFKALIFVVFGPDFSQLISGPLQSSGIGEICFVNTVQYSFVEVHKNMGIVLY